MIHTPDGECFAKAGTLGPGVNADSIHFPGSRTNRGFGPVKTHHGACRILGDKKASRIKPILCLACIEIRLSELTLFRMVCKCGCIEREPGGIIVAGYKTTNRKRIIEI